MRNLMYTLAIICTYNDTQVHCGPGALRIFTAFVHLQKKVEIQVGTDNDTQVHCAPGAPRNFTNLVHQQKNAELVALRAG